jgi:ADP-heptose:LPS heptosyltransferase
LLARLIADHRVCAALIGRENDLATARSILGPHGMPHVDNRVGSASLIETAALIERAALFVGCDSGPAHLAAAVGTPVVALFSGTNDARQWRPWGRRVEVVRNVVPCAPCHRELCPLADHPCMRGLSPAMVLAAVDRMLRESLEGSLQPSLTSTEGLNS